MFGRRFFGGRFFGSRFFGSGGQPRRYDPFLLGLDLTTLVEIQREVLAKDDRSATARTWLTVGIDIPASVHPKRMSAVPPQFRREGMGTWYRVYLYPDPLADGTRITTKHRILHKGRVLQVRVSRDIAELGEVLVVDAEEVG